MTPEQVDQFFAGVMAASPLFALGVVLFVLALFAPREK